MLWCFIYIYRMLKFKAKTQQKGSKLCNGIFNCFSCTFYQLQVPSEQWGTDMAPKP